ncbi:hypothetical protein PDN57_28475 [Bacillus cereus]|nr:hypothetical protein [Bacillus cereus]MDA2225457.1 hypothetical protein [Bacillus cereus]
MEKEEFVIKGKRVRNIFSKCEGTAIEVTTRGVRDMIVWIRDGDDIEILSPIKNMELID